MSWDFDLLTMRKESCLPRRQRESGFLLLIMAGFLWLLVPMELAAAVDPPPPAIVLLAQPTGGQAAALHEQFTRKVQERFPGREVLWAALPGTDSSPQPGNATAQHPDLAQVLATLQSRGITRVAVQSLAVLPDGDWEKQVADLQAQTGLKIAVGKPLLSSLTDRQRLLAALAAAFTNPQDQAVLLVGGGSQNPATLREYLALYTLLLAKFKGSNLFFGTSNSLPELKTALAALKKSPASNITIVPLPAFADGPLPLAQLEALEACTAALTAAKGPTVQVFQGGFGNIDGILAIYVDHLAATLEAFTPKKPERQKKGKK